jgi:hypothetical protein
VISSTTWGQSKRFVTRAVDGEIVFAVSCSPILRLEPSRQVLLVSAALKKKRYRDRDGAAEARSDAKARKPWKLLSHVFNGRAPGFVTPGLKNCDPRVGGPDHYDPLLEVDWSGGVAYSESSWEVAEEATSFAAAYNREMFRLRGDEINAVHRNAELS